MGGEILDREIERKVGFKLFKIIKGFGNGDIERAVVVGDDGCHSVGGERDGPDSFCMQEKRCPKKKGGD